MAATASCTPAATAPEAAVMQALRETVLRRPDIRLLESWDLVDIVAAARARAASCSRPPTARG